jgi:hypothetical protein
VNAASLQLFGAALDTSDFARVRATRKLRWVDVVGYADMAGETERALRDPTMLRDSLVVVSMP